VFTVPLFPQDIVVAARAATRINTGNFINCLLKIWLGCFVSNASAYISDEDSAMRHYRVWTALRFVNRRSDQQRIQECVNMQDFSPHVN
jgi:hypothetical protein